MQQQRPWLELEKGPHTVFWFDDFTTFPSMSGTAGAADVQLDETNAGATELLDPTETGGVLKGTHTAADPDIISMFWNWGIKLSDLKALMALEWGFRIKFNDVDDRDAFIGLGIYDADYVTRPADFVMARLLESEANGSLGIEVSKDSVVESATGIITLSDATYLRGFFRYTPGATQDIGELEYWFDTGTSHMYGTLKINGSFPDDVIIRPFIQDATGAVSAMTFAIDWFYVAGLRADYVEGTG